MHVGAAATWQTLRPQDAPLRVSALSLRIPRAHRQIRIPKAIPRHLQVRASLQTLPASPSRPPPSANGAATTSVPIPVLDPPRKMTVTPSCPLPNFSTTATRLTLLNPLGLLAEDGKAGLAEGGEVDSQPIRGQGRPLLVYLPGMDATGQVIRSQLSALYDAG